MELKFGLQKIPNLRAKSSNRTFMELKSDFLISVC